MSFGGFIQANTQVIVIVGPFVDVTDGFTPETGITLGAADEAELLKHGSSTVVDISGATWAAVTSCDGYYALTLTTSHTDTEGLITVVVQDDSVCLPVKMTWQVIAQAAFASLITAKDAGFMDVNIKTIGRTDTQETEASNLESACSNYSATRGLAGTALPAAAADAAGGLPISDAGGLDLDAQIGTDIDAILVDTGTTLDGRIPAALVGGRIDASVGAMANNVVTAAAVATGAIDADAIADSAIDAGAIADGSLTAAKFADNFITAAKIATDAITADKIAADAIGSSELAAGAATEIATAVTAALGTGSGLTTLATAAELAKVPKSDGTATWNATALASINAEVDTALNTAIPGSPTANSINERIAAIDDLTQAGGSGDLAAILTDTGTTLDGRIPAALVSGRMSADAVAISGSTTAADNVEANIANLDAAVSTRSTLTAADVNAACDTAISDAALATAANLATVASYIDTEVATLVSEMAKVPKSDGALTLNATANTAVVTAVFARAFSAAYGSLTFDEIMKLVASAVSGKCSGLNTTTVSYRNLADSANVIVATVDEYGNRSAVTRTP